MPDKVVVLPDDEDVAPVGGARTQDTRGGNAGRAVDGTKLRADVDKGLEQANGKDKDDEFEPEAQDSELAKIRRELAREKRRADTAEARAREQEGKTAEALDAKSQADLNTLKTSKGQLEEQSKMIEERLKDAYEAGDFNAIATLNKQQVQTTIDLNTINNGIMQIEALPKQRENMLRRGQNPSDEQRFAQLTNGMHPAAKQWFRDNPDYYRDDSLLKRVTAAHYAVMAEDDAPEPNTDEYFDRVEEVLAKRDPKFASGAATARSGDDDDPLDPEEDGDGAMSGASRGRRRQSDEPPPAAAPVTRSGRGAGGAPAGNGRTIRLSEAELEAAADSGLTPEEYARNKRALLREERIGPKARNRMH